jgi:DNA-binding MarR family transcriptional regulator
MPQDEYISFLIARTHRILRKRLRETLREFELTAQQFGVLSILYREDGLPARELVVRLFSDSSTIMDLVDRLEEKGLVKREADPKDRRVNPIFLTGKATSFMPKIMARVDRFEKAIHENLPQPEVEALKSGLIQLYRLAASRYESEGATNQTD